MTQTPWKNGLYYNSRTNTPQLYKVEGEKLEIFYTTYLDHPDILPISDGTWTYGDFGPARKEIKEASGATNNNLKIFAVGGMIQK